MKPRDKPLLIYDGECRFCRKWIERWKAVTGDRVDYASSQEAGGQFPEIPQADFAGSVQFIAADGSRTQGAEAVFRSLATVSRGARGLLWAHRHLPGFGPAAEAAYQFVSAQREALSKLTTLAWGNDLRPPTYAVANFFFLRVLGLIYVIAFASVLVQAKGLSGSHGVMPVELIFPQTLEAAGPRAYWELPSLVWLWPSEAMLIGLCVGGLALAILLIVGVAQPLALLGLWVAYLSLVVAGGVFYSFQWDGLLLETGFLAIFLAPWNLLPRVIPSPPPAPARLLMVWLLFRLSFASGLVKLTSGDPAWANFTALEFHYWTQPIPNAIAWFANLLPASVQKVSCAGMFAIELGLPFFLFLPRRFRMVAFCGLAGLQIAIELTGNYGFFNALTAAICLFLLDDAVWPAGLRILSRSPLPARWLPKWVLWPVAVVLILLSLVPFSGAFRRPAPLLDPVARAYSLVEPFRSINGYGLFAVMTKQRNEIIIQGSDDGVNWKTYPFKYKPGDVKRMPPFVAPYMPRLDWQMWFAALGDVRESPWMFWLVSALLKSEPDALALLESDPFDGRSPRHLRAMLDSYTFTGWQEWRETGRWWRAEPRAIYFNEIAADQFQ